MHFLDNIQKNHSNSLMALTLRSEDGGNVFVFKFDQALARKLGRALTAYERATGAQLFALNLTDPSLPMKYSNYRTDDSGGLFFDGGGEPDWGPEARTRLFALTTAGLSFHLGADAGFEFDSPEGQGPLRDIADLARLSRPIGEVALPKPCEKPMDQPEIGLWIDLDWLRAMSEKAFLGKSGFAASAAPSRSARI